MITRMDNYRLSVVFAALLLSVCLITPMARAADASGTASPPNVVIVFMDDLGYGDLGCTGATGYETPNIDALAAQGMRMTHFYTAQPVCSAARAALLTGCYPNRVGIHGALSPNAKVALNPDEKTIASMLKKSGYATAMFGKWHLGSQPSHYPARYGFDEFVGIPYSNDMWPRGYDDTPDPENKQKSKYPPLPLIEGTSVTRHLDSLEEQGEMTRLFTERSCDFIRRSRNEPFFVYLAHPMVHTPLAASPEFRGKSDAGLYGDVMMEIDWSVGEIMRTLDETNATSNTIVVFTSDNGPWRNFGTHGGSTGGLREGKGSTYEGGVRVPCVVRWPAQVPAGSVCNQIAATIDLLPTIAAAAGAVLPSRKIDGVDITGLLKKEPGANPRQELAYYHNKNELQAVRQGRWKLRFPHRSRTYMNRVPGKDGLPTPVGMVDVEMALYDLITDPGETVDLKDDYPDVVKQMEAVAEKYRQDLGDALTGAEGTGRREPAKM